MDISLSFKSFKNHEKVSESFSRGQATLTFHMMHKFPGTILSL